MVIILDLVQQVDYYENLDLENIVTPIKPDRLRELLQLSNYDEQSTEFLYQGFSQGFDIGYRGPIERTDTSENIPLFIGTKVELWNKIMKEVKLGRYAGPFDQIPFKKYMQSPIGLVPKAGNQTRLIFHLSYDFKSGLKSLNHYTPTEWCKVKYRGMDYTIDTCLDLLNNVENIYSIFYSKTDLKSAFRILPLLIEQVCWMVMKAEDPLTGKIKYFADKNLPFGASRSCYLFQQFSNCLKHLIEHRCNRFYTVTNYLDDFLFIGRNRDKCNDSITNFLEICEQIGCPVAMEKTEWAMNQIVFLGVLFDGLNMCLAIPEDKVTKAIDKIGAIVFKKKTTVKALQSLTGLLNFFNRALVPARAFTRRMYAKIPAVFDTSSDEKNQKIRTGLKPYHHVSLDAEFVANCLIWFTFLKQAQKRVLSICRPFVDLEQEISSTDVGFYSDASKSTVKGIGCVFKNRYIFAKYEPNYIRDFDPSIQYLELLALCMGIFTWSEELSNARVIIYCDNNAVKSMVNFTTSHCRNCMYLIRILVLSNLKYHRRIFVRHIASGKNVLADSLSRLNFRRFWDNAPENMNKEADQLPTELWPASKIWQFE